MTSTPEKLSTKASSKHHRIQIACQELEMALLNFEDNSEVIQHKKAEAEQLKNKAEQIRNIRDQLLVIKNQLEQLSI